MASGDIDPVEFGKLLASMEQTAKLLEQSSVAINNLTARVAELEDKLDTGRKGLLVIALIAGFAIFGVKETLTTLFKAMT